MKPALDLPQLITHNHLEHLTKQWQELQYNTSNITLEYTYRHARISIYLAIQQALTNSELSLTDVLHPVRKQLCKNPAVLLRHHPTPPELTPRLIQQLIIMVWFETEYLAGYQRALGTNHENSGYNQALRDLIVADLAKYDSQHHPAPHGHPHAQFYRAGLLDSAYQDETWQRRFYLVQRTTKSMPIYVVPAIHGYYSGALRALQEHLTN